MQTNPSYKKVVAVIREERFSAVEAALIEHGVSGLTVFPVRGFGKHSNFYRSDWEVSHLQIEVYVPKPMVMEVTATICQSIGETIAGDGILAVTPVDSFAHIHQPDSDSCARS